jgi:hypothetical protein
MDELPASPRLALIAAQAEVERLSRAASDRPSAVR